ncbi:hypothetical protein CLG96_01180 [Sphingomonas oleivorans]|uniref:Lipoprotein n=1 Tax=Sphingomonas oleivorans TaxID=1735121 RepID=A0A2T5G0Z8_9SPHN|nr:hypothetical protein [Sphingomonas oleivorans]PTQ12790.1 hypothetical protein CLG96_01180 [Sphingomonas oleivorans]
MRDIAKRFKCLPMAALVLLAACATPPAPPPPAPPSATPAPPAAPMPQPAVAWSDIPLTPGKWAYVADARGSSALFGRSAAQADFILRCDGATRTLTLSRPGTRGGAMTITTSYGATRWQAQPVPGPVPYIGAVARANDPFLDKIAFSRGRFTVAGDGLPLLVLPAWAEPARTIEDCRK